MSAKHLFSIFSSILRRVQKGHAARSAATLGVKTGENRGTHRNPSRRQAASCLPPPPAGGRGGRGPRDSEGPRPGAGGGGGGSLPPMTPPASPPRASFVARVARFLWHRSSPPANLDRWALAPPIHQNVPRLILCLRHPRVEPQIGPDHLFEPFRLPCWPCPGLCHRGRSLSGVRVHRPIMRVM